VAADALRLYSNYLIEQMLHMDVNCTAHTIALLRVETLWCTQIMDQNRAAHGCKMWCMATKRQHSDEDEDD
jgi:hypothetical protein